MSHIIVTIITTNHLLISDSPGLDERLYKFIFSMSCINCQLKRYKYKYKDKYKYKYKPTCIKVELTPPTKCFFSTSNSSSSNALLNAFRSLAWCGEDVDEDDKVGES